ncbi:MAG: BlaI/MecI/CopY family transcriptional regulator [Planctomycetaceae bacterium]|nr:BlaI/MecI/CopY family transcriptional regulator [Planctomycetaceae bacterium]
MPRSKRPKLSPGELRLMALLWDGGPLTLAEVHEAQGRDVALTTVQNQLNRLVEKKVVARSGQRPARYSATVDRQQMSRGFLDLLIETVGQGRVLPLMAQLVSRGQLMPDEVAQLRQLIDRAEAEAKSTRNKT